ncbi:MAG: hypothetical protein ACI30A_03320 [Paludibacteraceae bacterium]
MKQQCFSTLSSVRVWAVSLIVMVSMASYAADYQQSIGVVVGSFNGISYKKFVRENMAVQADLAFGVQATRGTVSIEGEKLLSGEEHYWDFVLNPNLLWQQELTEGLSMFAGGGLSLGLAEEFRSSTLFGKFGLNTMVGAEYKFASLPLSLSLDFRPGYGLLFANVEGYSLTANLFDWRLALGVRYCF